MYSFPFEIYRQFAGDENIGFAPEQKPNQYITYYGIPGLYKQLSFIDIFDETFDPAFVADRIVIIGSYASGLMDAYNTPMRGEPMHGVEIQANIVQMLLEGNFKRYVAEWVNFVILALIILAAMMLRRLWKYAGLLLIYLIGAWFVFDFGYIITLAYPVLALIVIYVYRLIYRHKMEEVKIAQLESELLQSQISTMLSQIQPHFLYNSLVAIQELCLIDSEEASETVAEFSKYLRHNIDSLSSKEPVKFEKELHHIEAYLSLEKKRFEEKLNIVYEIAARDFCIPALTLQPIVENAILHGVSQREGGGTVRICSQEKGGHIVITVADDGVGFDINAIGKNSVGIKNVRSRLAAMCGGRLDIQSETGAGTTATITIPIRGTKSCTS
jgi:sensor histidine kinase YesM